MSEIRPFSAVRYNTSANPDLSTRLAPPYDVLDREDRDRLLARDAANFVKLDLPHVPAKAAGPPEVYAAAKTQMDRWLAEGVLVRDSEPALYVYHQKYTIGGAPGVRKKFFARLRLEPFGSGSVFPHEQTFGGPKEDRLALTRATQCNLSPIFGLYPDVTNSVAARLDAAIAGRAPLATGALDGVDNTLWAVTDPAVIRDVQDLLRDKPTFIADGHHRYGTALLYREELAAAQGAPLPANHPANFVLCVLCSMEDPGLQILPTHRVLPATPLTPTRFREDAALEIAHLPVSSADDVPAALAPFGPQAVGFFSVSGDGGYYVIRPRNAELLAPLAPNRHRAWRQLGLAFLHAYLIDKVVAAGGASQPEVHYVKSAGAAVDEARSTGGSVFLMQPTTMQEMSEVCLAGELMPQKSTFFYPKLASGLVINPLA